jgi:GDP/GTP exchange factor required for growth at low temperature
VGNFNAVVAIIAGLQSEFVARVMHRSWNKVGTYTTRIFNDLVGFTSSTGDFQHIRRNINSLVDTKPEEVGSIGPSSVGATDGQSSRSKATADSTPLYVTSGVCVPFIGTALLLFCISIISNFSSQGVYLSQLYRHAKLPDLIDPTAPNETVSVDPITANFDAPAHPEVFSSLAPLPASMQLEPLINVQKQRLFAGVIKSLVAGQHLASRVQFPVDKKLFQKCLKLRGLDNETLQRVFAIYSE